MAKKLSAARRSPHFSKHTLKFLSELAVNNNRDWFNANRLRYEQQLLDPALDFIEAMGPPLAAISSRFLCIPKRVGGSLLRIHRDARFSRDKTPYKTNVGIQFRHEIGKDIHAPGYYFHIGLDECFLGVGLWHPDSPALARIRDMIVEKPRRWRAASTEPEFRSHYEFRGDTLKRAPRGVSEDHPLIVDLKRKDFIAIHQFDHGLLYEPDLVAYVAERFAVATPLMKFLCDSQELAF